MMQYAKYDSPVGTLLLEAQEGVLTGLWMNREVPENIISPDEIPLFRKVFTWLDAYFRGEFRDVDFPFSTRGTRFQKLVWQRLLEIPYGTVDSYGIIAREIARDLGKETMSAQAVGQAVGKNPISIIIPCHRVVGSKGQLTGYAGGLEKKRWLLSHEGWREITYDCE